MKRALIIILVVLLCCINVEAKGKKRNIKFKEVPISRFSAKSYIVADENGHIISMHDGDEVRPIASITKLMLSFIVSYQDLNEELSIPSVRKLKTAIPRKTKVLTRQDLISLALIKSDNLAADILCNNLPNCIERMNTTATVLGMKNTKFEDATGLSQNNVSTASDLLKLLMIINEIPILSRTSSLPSVEIYDVEKLIKIRNTNPLVFKIPILLSKTGYTNSAGGCLVMITMSENKKRYFILLGSKNSKSRVSDMEELIKKYNAD